MRGLWTLIDAKHKATNPNSKRVRMKPRSEGSPPEDICSIVNQMLAQTKKNAKQVIPNMHAWCRSKDTFFLFLMEGCCSSAVSLLLQLGEGHSVIIMSS
jgi:hypothetical protein